MQGLKDLLSTEHGIFGVLLVIAATILCALGIMPIGDWKSFAQVIFVAYAGTHAVVTSASSLTGTGGNARLPKATALPKRDGDAT